MRSRSREACKRKKGGRGNLVSLRNKIKLKPLATPALRQTSKRHKMSLFLCPQVIRKNKRDLGGESVLKYTEKDCSIK